MRVLDLFSELMETERRALRLQDELIMAEAEQDRLRGLLTQLLRSRDGRPIIGFSAFATLDADGEAVIREADYAHDVVLDETAMHATMTGHVESVVDPGPDDDDDDDAMTFPREATPSERLAMSREAWGFYLRMQAEEA